MPRNVPSTRLVMLLVVIGAVALGAGCGAAFAQGSVAGSGGNPGGATAGGAGAGASSTGGPAAATASHGAGTNTTGPSLIGGTPATGGAVPVVPAGRGLAAGIAGSRSGVMMGPPPGIGSAGIGMLRRNGSGAGAP